ncbi:putative conserved ATPase [Tsukamurella pulmonis]|uniref:Transitional endoplasmic reticulum ATPase n=1 Tax=Tsukamurella pulmonis TaxID=47312 RepID=A0A1H1BVS3_9ACTN|nr:AAA family ATPase [Tsukamurella pulmonis]KXO90187.1 ATPase [Tsukamurella pulmonis]KXP11440.1 ATPase [Tsukamurella pulmonis]RDH10516.1 AAA family ATPase [Tsukamurella pulmonis]SDQ55850.1 transitional endoplasmic reticulum ATPase [Tsukamurella pulmonis]SUP24608.1 ATP-dependent zinc metalloprotease FtsH [Tsukamurella pulmonis]
MSNLSLTVRLQTSALEARRGIVRIHPEALAALGLREWDGIELLGARRTAAVVAAAPSGTAPGVALLDELTITNCGLREDATVVISPATVYGAKRVLLRGSTLTRTALDGAALRQALLGKVMMPGDSVSLLPRDLGPGTSTADAVQQLSRLVGITWTNELLTVVSVDPSPGPVSVQPNSAVMWADDDGVAVPAPASAPAVTFTAEVPEVDTAPVRPVADLVGADDAVRRLTEWISLALDEPELLEKLGAPARLGVLITGPTGGGKATVARSVVAPRPLIELDGALTGALESQARLDRVRDAAARAIAAVGESGSALLVRDVEALLPATREPVSTVILDELRRVVATPRVALLATTSAPGELDSRLREPDLAERTVTVDLPDAKEREQLLELLLREAPTAELDLHAIALRAPGFVAADLAALCREGALRAAARVVGTDLPIAITQPDLLGALSVIRPVSRSATEEVAVGSITLDDVGDMVETKQALTETVLWPLRHPDTFARLGVEPPRGVLLYGPPGCGKTFVVRALAASGQLSVHAVKGAELMNKWVGESEKAVRDLFARARGSAPSLIFLDEVDALAPRRGQSSDSGVGDKVVASLLTELDGAEPLRDVVVLGATNRPDLVDPALLRPGRLERLIFVPPPDAQARAEILRTSSRAIPLADDVDLEALAEQLDGYSAADCSALLREAALTAMRRDLDAAIVTAAEVEAARQVVRPSLDPAQVADLQAYADRRAT